MRSYSRWAKSKSRTPALTLSLVVPRTKTRAHRMSSGSPGTGFPIGLDVEAGSGGGRRRREGAGNALASCSIAHQPHGKHRVQLPLDAPSRQSRLRMLWWGLFINGVYNNLGYVIMLSASKSLPPRASAAYVLLFDDSPPSLHNCSHPCYLVQCLTVLVSFLSHAATIASLAIAAVCAGHGECGWTVPIGSVALVSVCFGVGESTFFSLLSTESSDSIGAFASGTGGRDCRRRFVLGTHLPFQSPHRTLMIATTIPVHAVVFLRLVLPSIRGIHSKRVDGCPGSKALSPAVSSFRQQMDALNPCETCISLQPSGSQS